MNSIATQKQNAEGCTTDEHPSMGGMSDLYDADESMRRDEFSAAVRVSDIVREISRDNNDRTRRANAAGISYARQQEIDDEEWFAAEAERLGMTMKEFKRYLWGSYKRR